jgi:hypothetical protein
MLNDEGKAGARIRGSRLFIHHSAFRIHHFLSLCLLFALAPAAWAQQAQSGSETAETRSGARNTGVITGRVVSDDGRPLPDVMVYLYNPYSRQPTRSLTATTDSEGKFQVSGLAPGLYSVSASYPGFITAPSQTASTESGDNTYYRLGDFVDLKLIKGGVITGTVRDSNNEPAVAIPVRATLVRDAQGHTLRFTGPGQFRMTDDRGIYRLYGLRPGTYIVSAGGNVMSFSMVNAYEGEVPTYYPSSTTRDTASEVSVRSGDEAANTDIRYRRERGHTVSGTISSTNESGNNFGFNVMLRSTASGGGIVSTTFVMPTGGKPGFAFDGIADGEYELMAQQPSMGETIASTPRRVIVKGADVTGLELQLATLASIEGHVTLEPAPKKDNCEQPRGTALLETLINARRAEKIEPKETPLIFFSGSGGVPTEQGDFQLRNLQGGSYRLTARLTSDAWYVRSITLPVAATAPARQSSAAAKPAETKGATPPSALIVKAGEHVTGIGVLIAQDAAALRGRVVAATEGASLPANLKVHLVPAERERAEDILRYSEASVGNDGAFVFNNLAPGRYLLVTRQVPDIDSPDRDTRPLAWDADTRAKLRREAEAANNATELQPCQRVSDFVLRYAPPQATTKP